jgi:uncharacterized protein YciI
MKTISIYLILVFAISCIGCKNHTKQESETKDVFSKYDLNTDTSVYTNEMKRFWLVLLKKGPNRNQDSISAEKIQAAHLANISRLAKEGKIIMAGPIGVEAELRGIFLMNCNDSLEVQQFVNTDTAVITGRLIMEYYPWWTSKGKFIFK